MKFVAEAARVVLNFFVTSELLGLKSRRGANKDYWRFY